VAPPDPRPTLLAVLDRVIYLLDRSRAPSYRVRVYARAARTLAALPAGELAGRVEAGTLEELPGIGPVIAGLLTEAAGGGTPRYLSALEESTQVPLPEPAAPYRAALRGDCHVHSDWSDGGATIESMARAAAALGHEYLVLTDHSPRLTIAHGLDRDRLEAQLAHVAELNVALAPFRILTGMEVDIHLDGSLDLDDDLLARLDVVVASVHSKLRMDHDPMTARMVRAVQSPHVDILGHCTGRIVVGRGRPQSSFDPVAVFEACAGAGTAVEINCRPERQDPPDDLLALALEAGCEVAIDTDAHAPGQLEWLAYGCERAAAHRIPLERILNTRPAGELAAGDPGLMRPTGA
jgi:putative hydrolase